MKRRKSLSRIKRIIKRSFESNDLDKCIETISREILIRDEKIEGQAKALEIMNRQCLPLDKRFLEVIKVDSSTSKITINPCTGRITLKISDKCSEKVIEDYQKLVEQILFYDKFEPMTFRGKIKFHEDKYKLCLQSESKRFSHNFTLNQ